MLLSDIKRHLQNKGQQSLLELSRTFNIQSAVVQDMLAVLIRKGQVRVCMKTPRCGTQCSQCSALVTQNYEWVNQ